MTAPRYQPGRPARFDTLTVGSLRYALRRWGRPDGKPVILLHGWMDCSATFQFMVDAAPPSWLQYNLIAPDWRGFGDSDWATEGYYFPDYLADLDGLLTAIAPDQPVTLVGHSMGGIVACLYAGIRPERVSHLVALEGFGLAATTPSQAPERYRRWLDQRRQPAATKQPDKAALTARLQMLSKGLPAAQAEWLVEQWLKPVDEGWAYRADPRHKWTNPVLYRLEEAQACWRAATAKTLWLAGDEARLLAWLDEDAEQFARRQACFARLEYRLIAGSGHNLHHTAAAAVAGLIDDFLGR